MATSGTTSQTLFRNQALIDHAGRLAGLTPQQITGEHIVTALECLYLATSRLANRGIPLWRVAWTLLPMYQARQSVPCPVGVVDAINVNLRRLQRLSGTAQSSGGVAANAFDGDVETTCDTGAPNGTVTLALDSASPATSFGVLPSTGGPWTFDLQGSDDGATYATLRAFAAQAMVAGEWLWFDVEGVPAYAFYRLRATLGTVLRVAEFVVANTPNEVPLALINRDDYNNLPDKTFQGRPTQYWLDKQRLQQTVVLWPAPGADYTFYQLRAQLQRYPEDVGTMGSELDVPQRWYDCMVDDLAVRLCREIKEADRNRLPELKESASYSWRDAWAGESDRAPSRLTPRIRGYTR